jgi:hypothetical protein
MIRRLGSSVLVRRHHAGPESLACKSDEESPEIHCLGCVVSFKTFDLSCDRSPQNLILSQMPHERRTLLRDSIANVISMLLFDQGVFTIVANIG